MVDDDRRMRERRAAAFRGAFVNEEDNGTEMLSRRTKIQMYILAYKTIEHPGPVFLKVGRGGN